jgi:hypothetical protein
MSTATAAPRIDGATYTLTQAKAIRSAAASTLAKPMALAKKLLAAAAGGWKAALKMIGNALSVVPTVVKSTAIAAPFSTTRSYEWVRETARKTLKFGVNAVGVTLFWGVAAIALPLNYVEQLISKITRGRINMTIVDTVGAAVVTGLGVAFELINKGIEAAFAILGHKTAVRTVTTGATVITGLVAAEGVSIAAASAGLIPTTVSGFVLGTPMLAGLPLLPAILTSTGVVAISIGVLVLAGGIAAMIFHKDEVSDILDADLSPAVQDDAVVVDETVVTAEVDQLMREARQDLEAAAVAEAVVRQAKPGKKHHHNRK